MSDKRRNYRLTFLVATLLLAAVAVFLVSVFSNFTGARLDLTEDKLFTMSPAAVNILENLSVPVQVKLYITPEDRMPTEFKNLERDITEQLTNYERISDGKLEFSVYYPQDDEEMQQELAQKGIQPFQVQSVDKDEIGVKLIWSAITIAYKDFADEVIPRLLPQQLANLETIIISPVHRLTREDDPKVALYAPKRPIDPQMAQMYLQQGMQPPAPQEIYSQVKQLLEQEHYQVVPVELTEDSTIPDDADVVVVLGPRNLNERQAWELNRALSNGTPMVMAVQSHEYQYQPGQQGQWTIAGTPNTTGVDDLLAGFGLTVVKDHFLDLNSQMLELPREVNLGGLRMQVREPVDSPVQVRITQDQVNQDQPVTNHIGALLYLWGTPIDLDAARLAEHGLQTETLIESSGRAWRADFGTGLLTPTALDPSQNEMLPPQPLMVLVEGEFPDSFAGQEVPAWPEAAPAGDEEEASGPEPMDTGDPLMPAPASLLLVGSAKMFDDAVLGGAQNALLMLNAVDYLAGNSDLLTIRSKQLTARTIRPVPAGEKIVWQIVTVAMVPALFVILGVMRLARRRAEAARYRREIQARA